MWGNTALKPLTSGLVLLLELVCCALCLLLATLMMCLNWVYEGDLLLNAAQIHKVISWHFTWTAGADRILNWIAVDLQKLKNSALTSQWWFFKKSTFLKERMYHSWPVKFNGGNEVNHSYTHLIICGGFCSVFISKPLQPHHQNLHLFKLNPFFLIS